jgi:hypothetical protein
MNAGCYVTGNAFEIWQCHIPEVGVCQRRNVPSFIILQGSECIRFTLFAHTSTSCICLHLFVSLVCPFSIYLSYLSAFYTSYVSVCYVSVLSLPFYVFFQPFSMFFLIYPFSMYLSYLPFSYISSFLYIFYISYLSLCHVSILSLYFLCIFSIQIYMPLFCIHFLCIYIVCPSSLYLSYLSTRLYVYICQTVYT